jgi:colanic acid/amylovoran biosynthesis glycosyltransferase
MRVVIITARFPFGKGEGFLIDEIRALSKAAELFVVPTTLDTNRPIHPCAAFRTIACSAISVEVLFGALSQLVATPKRSISVMTKVIGSDRRWKIRIKNLLILPKALWLASKLMQWRIEHVHAHWASAPATLAWASASIAQVTWSFTAHRWDIVEANALAAKLGSCSFARAISNSGARQLKEVRADGPIVVVGMGVTVPVEAAQVQSRERLRVLVPANLIPVKGHRYLLEALAILKGQNVVERCLFAGDGPERAALTSFARKLEVDDVVEFLGTIAHREVLELYATSKVDIVVLPSVVLPDGEMEGVPVSLMEAMAFSVPVISTRTGAIAELLDGVGTLVEPANPRALADALQHMVNPDSRFDLGLKSRNRIDQEHNVNRIAPKIHELILEALTPERRDR